MIVGAEEDRESSGVARASEVLHQQRVEQRRALVGGQLKLRRDPHADQAAANGVSLALSLGQVERIGQTREHLGEPDIWSMYQHGFQFCESD